MKANEFIKKFGLELAKRDVQAFESGFIKREDIVEHYGFDILDDLKRLVESHELVENWGGLDDTRFALQLVRYPERLKQAIADVESCQ